MKRANPILVIAVICFSFVVHGQPKPINRLSPDALVADLYREHNRKHSPFFQTRSRALLYKYFEKNLADAIWKDAVHSKGEVGAIDGDPLYDAQDMEIKKFAIDKATFAGRKLWPEEEYRLCAGQRQDRLENQRYRIRRGKDFGGRVEGGGKPRPRLALRILRSPILHLGMIDSLFKKSLIKTFV